MMEDYPHWMDNDMIRASEYASIRHIRQTLVRDWSESCYVVCLSKSSAAFPKEKWPNIKALI